MTESGLRGRLKTGMKVLCYYPWIYLRSGVERTMLEYAKRSRHQIAFATNHFDAGGTYPGFAHFPVMQLPFHVSVKRTLGTVTLAAWKIFLSRLNCLDYDVLLVHCDGLGNLILFGNHRKPVVCFCHTPLRIAYDSHYISRHCEGNRVRRIVVQTLGKVYRRIDRCAWRYYDYVFFNSREVFNRCHQSGLAVLKSSILHPGIDGNYTPKSPRRERFLLCPGRIMWTKNIESAILGFRMAKNDKTIPQDMELVVAGMVDRKSRRYLASLKTLARNGTDITFVETPSDEQLFDLYNRCFAVVFPAFNEDWGIVPLEAMLFGKVVISSDTGGPRESVLPGRTGWLVTPDAEGIVRGIKECMAHEKQLDYMSRCCVTRAREFTWERFTHEMDDTLEGVVLQSRHSTTRQIQHSNSAWRRQDIPRSIR